MKNLSAFVIVVGIVSVSQLFATVTSKSFQPPEKIKGAYYYIITY